jgi:hypothetical protein
MPRYSDTPLVFGASCPINRPEVVFTGAPIWKPPVEVGLEALDDDDDDFETLVATFEALDVALKALDEALEDPADFFDV